MGTRRAIAAAVVAIVITASCGTVFHVLAQTRTELPPLSYVCIMPQDSDVIEDKPGKCSKCGMDLKPIRLDTRWSCPIHPMVIKDGPGKCPIDGRDLVQVTVSVYFTCPDHSDVHEINPGQCADGRDRVTAYERRAHGDHNPRHGGQFFMASDNWHHLEGTYPSTGVFRVFLYDDYTRPLAARGFSGHVLVGDLADTSRPTTTFDLKPAPDGKTLVARVGRLALPAHVTAKVKFDPRSPEQQFDFTFQDYTRDPAAAARHVITATAKRTNTAKPAGATRAPTPPKPPAADVAVPVYTPAVTALNSVDLPTTAAGLLDFVNTRNHQLKALLDQGKLDQLWLSALECKDAALALQTHASELPEARRSALARAVKTIVLSAWRIDRFGDLGNRQVLTETYQTFSTAVTDINQAYGSAKR